MDEKTKDELFTRFYAAPEGACAWAEEAAYGNLRGRIESGIANASQAATTLTLLLAGMGGALAYAVRVFEPGPASPVAWGAAALCAYLAVLAIVLLARCINAAPAPMLYNAPANLLVAGADLATLRCGELVNLQERIEQQTARNLKRAKALNAIRLWAAASPVLFALVSGAVLAYR